MAPEGEENALIIVRSGFRLGSKVVSSKMRVTEYYLRAAHANCESLTHISKSDRQTTNLLPLMP